VLFVVRVSSDKQTLILAGEPTPPPRPDAGRTHTDNHPGTGTQLQRVTMLLVQGEYAAGTITADPSQAKAPAVPNNERVLLPSPAAVEGSAAVDAPAVSAQLLVPQPWSGRTLSPGAGEYARMQNLSGGSSRIQLIDTYA
jgi:hypothetical protein